MSAMASRGPLRGWQEGNAIILRESIIIIHVYVYVYYLYGAAANVSALLDTARIAAGPASRESRAQGGHVIVFAS